MEYPRKLKLNVANVFPTLIDIALNSGLTVFVGENGSGKTQTMKSLRDELKKKEGEQCVRYLSSNRIGMMEEYRSQTRQYQSSTSDFDLGNMSMLENRRKIETANADFLTMYVRRDVLVKVSERLSVLFNRNVSLKWDGGYLKAYFQKNTLQKEYLVVHEASGLVNVISILAALYDDEVKVLLIDEPEVSLHPQLQAYLLSEIKQAIKLCDKTVIISTHSTDMIPMNTVDDFCNIVFFEEGKLPIQVSPDAQELQAPKLREFILTAGLIHKRTFFARKILLVEGDSDDKMCRFLSNKLNIETNIAGAEIISVGGKDKMPVIMKFFKLIGKEVCILTDLDGFIDNSNIVNLFYTSDKLIEIAKGKPIENYSIIINQTKASIESLAENEKENVRSIYEAHPYWKIGSEDEEKTRRERSIIAQLFSHSKDEIKKWPNSQEWLDLKNRLEIVFADLREAGCFILKKGSLESYYCFAPKDTYTGKINAVNDEISNLMEKDNKFIEKNYEDIIVALKFISLTRKVDESAAVKKELLSELPVAIYALKEQKDINFVKNEIKQRKNSISFFDYEIVHNGERDGLKVSMMSKIIKVKGFPFEIYTDENVNSVVNIKIEECDEQV